MNSKNSGSKIHQLARLLRRNRTTAEAKLWACLREGQQGCQFRRQFPIGEFIVDFCCRQRRLVIELDGSHHGDDPNRVLADRKRTALIEERGYRVIRFWNEEVLTNLEGVLERIVFELTQATPT